jgi:hypothetical protein
VRPCWSRCCKPTPFAWAKTSSVSLATTPNRRPDAAGF